MKLCQSCSILTALFLSGSVNAAIVSADWQNSGDNLITRDTASGMEWLDLKVSASRSYNDISSKFGSGQEFDGWRYATMSEVGGLFDAFGGDSNFYYSGFSAQNNGLLDNIGPLWGDLLCNLISCGSQSGYTQFITVANPQLSNARFGVVSDYWGNEAIYDYVKLDYGQIGFNSTQPVIGSALVRASVVPVPAALWLFGSGLLGLISMSRRKAGLIK